MIPEPLQVAYLLDPARTQMGEFRVVTGFDGFVDEMTSVVAERQSLAEYQRVDSIPQFANLVAAAAGRNSLREIVIQRADAGGCAVNMADGLATLGVHVTTFATVGEPVHAAFSKLASKASLHSWGREPGRTVAMEFADGKLMFSAVSHLAEFTPAMLEHYLEDGQFQAACEHAIAIGITDWTLYPHMTECWKFLLSRVFKHLPHRPAFFFDLVDPSSRSDADIREMLMTLPEFEKCGTVTLGLNRNEAGILARILGVDDDDAAASVMSAALLERLGVSEVVIHSQRDAALASADGSWLVDGWYSDRPAKSTGAGDRFNAGYTLGMILKMDPCERLTLALATAGAYVRSGQSPDLQHLIDFLKAWHAHLETL